jgi:hypothetical protein
MTEQLHVAVSFSPALGYVSAASHKLPRSLTALSLEGLRCQVVVDRLTSMASGFIHMAEKAFILIPRRKDKAMKFRPGKSACKSLRKSFSEGKARS